jgi:hypothetical protein
MALTITDIKQVGGKDYQVVTVKVAVDGDNCLFTHSVPKLDGDDLQSYADGREDWYKRELLRNMYEGADCYDGSLEDWEAWTANGYINAEQTKTITTPAQPAVDAVMGERQKTVESSEEVTTTEIVEVDGKMVQKSVTNTVVTNTPETKDVPLFDEAGEEVGTTTVPVMESYEVTPAVEAVEEQIETVVTRAESVVEKVAWKDTVE